MALRAECAGHQLAEAIVEMVNLMYQNNTAAKFYSGLAPVLNKEIERRSLDIKIKKIAVQHKISRIKSNKIKPEI